MVKRVRIEGEQWRVVSGEVSKKLDEVKWMEEKERNIITIIRGILK